MRGLRLALLVLIAVAFAAGGIMRAAPAQASVMPPCHEMAMDDMAGMHHAPAPADADHKSKPGAMATSCCVGCLPAGQRVVAGELASRAATAVEFVALNHALDGLDATPEPRPPRG
ncbi:hypothetical protein [Caulobacter hibisci]|uniref:DUF2946 domain-containing protein n=1 Tax=Caulobacter hibisci TaxID=2035993 RepID=A0ABS0SWD4_9CAUL|nr:hypothetical protein [Caulobacter hibisci]MBI1683937.1 hypothetical protein [Caulobacter hibisci]